MGRRLIREFDEEPVRRFVADARFMQNILAALVNRDDDGEVFVAYEELGAGVLFTVEVVEAVGGVTVRLVREDRDDA